MKPDHEGKRRFKRNGNMIHVNVTDWREKFTFAARQIGVDLNPLSISPPEKYRPASVHLYNRVFNRVDRELFESFRKGTVLTLDFLIHEEMKKAPTPVELKTMFMIVGEYQGISQWGGKFGFGRFDVLGITPKLFAPTHADNPMVQRGSPDRESDTLPQEAPPLRA
jgi:hypothetical protein